LQFDHWQANSEALTMHVHEDLENFLRHYPEGQDAEAWAELRHPDTLQLVTLKLFQDLEELVRTEHLTRQKSGDQVSVVKVSNNQILALVLSPSGALEAKVYPNMALVWGARLRLVAPVSQLFYTPELELMPHVRQTLEGSLLTTHCFQVNQEGAHGLVTRGHTFQKFETYIRAQLSETQDLFASLKKIERHFINPQSDPYYQDMVARLERANRMLALPSVENLMAAEKALNRGRTCLKNVFPNDRLLTLLVTHLDYGIRERQQASQHSPQ
jgi:hypothetical protein